MRIYKHHILYIIVVAIIFILSLVFIENNNSSNNVSALSYESSVGVGFTFNPTLSISLSSNDLIIPNLVPGNSSDSNNINVSVATNAAYGYTLLANVGSENLVHSSIDSVFDSISTSANLVDLNDSSDDNIWGYSYKNNLAPIPTWSNYSGLSTDANKVLFKTDSNINNTIDFKIGAKASTTQPSGVYNNTINFIAISKPMPKTIDDIAYMQTFGELVSTDLESVKNSMILNHTYTLKDIRDEQEYTIAKLNDGKIWMTKNLNLAGGTTLTSDTTDFDSTYTIPETQGWQANGTLPASSTSGFSNDNYAYVYNSNNEICSNNNPCYSYYSWDAATVGSGRNLDDLFNNENAPYSICPKGWHLPSTSDGENSSTDFRTLAIMYGGSSTISDYNEDTSPTGSTMFSLIGPSTVPNFLLTGYLGFNSFYRGGEIGFYHSSTTVSRLNFVMSFGQLAIKFDNTIYRSYGAAIRCIAE